jgi:glucosyl-dolichyl phosphate glucuronosyltransferase
MDISVIICTHNRCQSLKKVLNDLEHLVIPEGLKWEVVIVDNHSNDNTKNIINEFQKKDSIPLKYIFEERKGKSYALNTGLREADGEIMAFTDDDVQVHPQWLEQLIEIFKKFECLGIGGKIIPTWTSDKPQWLIEEGPYKLMTVIVKYDLGKEPCEIMTPPWGANMAFKRIAFDQYGFFRTDLGPNPVNLVRGEDSEFCMRLIRGGEKIIYAPEVIVYHPVEKERTEKGYFKLWYYNYGRALIRVDSNHGDTVCYFGVPRYLLRKLLENCFLWIIMFNTRRRFYFKLQCYQLAGEIAEFLSISKKFK